MGLLDQLGTLAGQLGGTTAPADPKAALVQGVLAMLMHGNEPGGVAGAGGFGGLPGLLQRFQNAGLGPAVESWLGSGPNAAVSPSDVHAALGGGPLATLAAHAGIDEADAARHLSTILPEIVDRLTPQGQVPTAPLGESHLGDVVQAFSHLFGR